MMRKEHSLLKLLMLSFFSVLIAGKASAQTTPTILINGQSVMASIVTGSPYWMHSGQTLAVENLTKFISVLEYGIAPSQSGGNTLQFENVISVTTVQTVPTNKAWKLESVAIDPSAAVFGGDNLGNHVATTHLTMSNNRISTLANPVALADAVNTVSLQNGGLNYAIDTGAPDAYAISLAIAPAAYTIGMVINFKASNPNGGLVAPTLNVNSLGAKNIKKQGGTSDLAQNDIVAGQMVTVVYDGTDFQIIGQLGNAAAAVPHGRQTFTSNGTFNVPAGVTKVWLSMAGGGGGGRGGTGGSGGGGGGASAMFVEYAVTPLDAISINIGTGGAGGNSANGAAGTATSFGSFSCGGGAGANGQSGGAGGTGSPGSVPGTQGGSGSENLTNGIGGGNLFGTGASNVGWVAGTTGGLYGGGGSGGGNGNKGGDGAPGFVMVEW